MEGETRIGKHRIWRKLRVMLDANPQRVVSAETTANSVDDASVVPNLPSRRDGRGKTLLCDVAYDKRNVYNETSEGGIKPLIPPRKNARLDHVGAWGRTVVIATTPSQQPDHPARASGRMWLNTIDVLLMKPSCLE